MKSIQASTILLLLGSSHAFTATPSFGFQTMHISMSEPEAIATVSAESAAAQTPAVAVAEPSKAVVNQIIYTSDVTVFLRVWGSWTTLGVCFLFVCL